MLGLLQNTQTVPASLNPATRDLLQCFGQMLDGLHTAMCVFDPHDRALVWNRTFFQFFPEHEGQLHEGEHYRDNLRRFYSVRLKAPELPEIDRYINTGLARHQAQSSPYEFDHRGMRLRVSSLPLDGVGRVRLWRLASPALPAEGQGPMALPTALLDRMPDGLMVCAPDGRIQWVNESFVLMYGLRDAAAAVSAWFEAVYAMAWAGCSGPEAALCQSGRQTLRENLRFVGAPFELPLPGNRFCRVIARPADDGSVFYAHVDVSELRRQQQKLAQAERTARESAAQLARKSALLQATLEGMEQGIAMINTEGVVEFYNQHILDLLDLPRELLDRRPTLAEVIRYQWAHNEFEGVSEALGADLAADAEAPSLRNYERTRPNGRILEVRSLPVGGAGMLRTYTDVTERRLHEQRIEHLASHDSLTGLLNRAKFIDCLASEVALARRTSSVFAVLYLDLDGFKPINDRHGHAVGDGVLVWVARVLGRVARESDFVARLGGDEFAVLQRGITQHDQALRLAGRLVQALSEPFLLDGLALQIGASVGVALYPEHGASPETLLVSADKAMYAAKAGQRGGGSLVPPRGPSDHPG